MRYLWLYYVWPVVRFILIVQAAFYGALALVAVTVGPIALLVWYFS